MKQKNTLLQSEVKSQDILQKRVLSFEGEDLGKIEEIILDKLQGNLRYLILAFGGFLGIGSKYVVIPWRALYYDKIRDCFILKMSKETIYQAAEFDLYNWDAISRKTEQEPVYV